MISAWVVQNFRTYERASCDNQRYLQSICRMYDLQLYFVQVSTGHFSSYNMGLPPQQKSAKQSNFSTNRIYSQRQTQTNHLLKQKNDMGSPQVSPFLAIALDDQLKNICRFICYLNPPYTMQTQQIKVFIRNSKKYGKILAIPPTISSGLLRQKAAEANHLRADEVYLHFEGKLLPTDCDTDITLHDKAIIHLIDLNKVNQSRITLQVVRFGDSMRSVQVETDSQIKVKDFIDSTISENYGLKSTEAFLVHIGRQLKLNKSFSEQHVQDGSEVVCVSIDYLKSKGKNVEAAKEGEPKEEEFAPTVDVKGLETPEEPRDIYPSADFTIAVPEEVNATNNLNLIFDAKVKHVGSLRNYDLEPEEIIPEEEPLAFRESENTSQVSQIAAAKENQDLSQAAAATNSEKQPQQTAREDEAANELRVEPGDASVALPVNRQLTQSESERGVQSSLIDA